MSKILYLGDYNGSSTSYQRANALKRIGHEVTICDVKQSLNKNLVSGIIGAINYRTGFRFIQSYICKWVKTLIKTGALPDIIWIDSGELFGPASLKLLKIFNCPIILYNVDDPTGGRDGQRFGSLLKALKYYDLCVVVREENVSEFKAYGATNVIRLYRSYDEVAHAPFDNIADIPDKFKSEVVFIGTWIKNEKRDEFILSLIQNKVPVSIWGNRWDKSPYWEKIKFNYLGTALYNRDYIAAVQGSKICIGLLSKGNRDLHTQRSLEIPFAGGLFCAERTSEHSFLYKEGREAVFWSDEQECAQVCKQLLENDENRELIRLAGMKRIRELHLGNEDICKIILKAILDKQPNS